MTSTQPTSPLAALVPLCTLAFCACAPLPDPVDGVLPGDAPTDVPGEPAAVLTPVSELPADDPATAQPVFICLGDAEVVTEADLELLADCERITGDLLLDGAEVANLSLLSNLREVGGQVLISTSGSLVTLAGLENLERIGGAFTLSYNWALEGLALPALEHVGGLHVEQQHALAYLELGALQSVTGDVFIDPNWNHGLEEIDLGALERVEGDFTVQGAYMLSNLEVGALEEVDGLLTLNWGYTPEAVIHLDALTDAGGLVIYGGTVTELHLPKLEGVWGNLDLAVPGVQRLDMPALELIVGRFSHGGLALQFLDLTALQEVRGDLLFASAGLEDLQGLSRLEEVHGVLQLRGMDNLRHTHGLQQLREVDALVIEHNAALTEVHFADLERVRGDVEIVLNPALTSVRLPSVSEVGGDVQVDNNLLLGMCELSSLLSDLDEAAVDGQMTVAPGAEAEPGCP